MTKTLKISLIAGIALIIGVAVFFIFRKSHSEDADLKVIPKNAAAVLKIDIKALAVKADILKLMNEPAFKNPGGGSLQQLIADPFKTGINPAGNIYGFISKEGDHQDAGIAFNVSDASKLNDFANSMQLSPNAAVNENGVYFLEIEETKCLAWNEEAGLIIATNSGEAKADALKYLAQTKENSVTENADYKTFAAKTFDIGVFFNNNELSTLSGAGNPLATLGLSDGHGELLLNFENDKIAATYSNFSSTTTANSILKKNGVDAKQFDAISSSPPLVYLGLSADVSALLAALRRDSDMKDNLTMMEMGLNLSEDEIKNLFPGDISLAFTDFKDISGYDPRIGAQVTKMMHQPGAERSDFALNTPMCYVSIAETDDAKMDSVLAHSGLSKIENFYAMPGMMYIVYAAAKDGHLLITNDYYAAETLSQTGKLTSTLPTEISKTDPLVFWTDLNQKHFPIALTETLREMYGDESMDFGFSLIKPFQNIRMTGKGNSSELDIAIEPGEGNSLHRLLSYYGSLLK